MGEEKSAVGGFFLEDFFPHTKFRSFLASYVGASISPFFSLFPSLYLSFPLSFLLQVPLSISIFFLLLVPSPRSLPYLPPSFLSLSLSCLFACRHRKKSPMQLFFSFFLFLSPSFSPAYSQTFAISRLSLPLFSLLSSLMGLL